MNRIDEHLRDEMNANSQILFTWEGDYSKQIKLYRINHYMLDMEFFFEGVPTWYS